MLFGYTLAVIAGFLFTAVRNWTGQPTPTGTLLAAYAALWISGRILVLTPFALASALVNAAFPLAVAAGIAVPLVKAANRRNYFFIALLAGCGVVELLFHLSLLGIVVWPARLSLQAGLDIVLFVIAVVAGRVIPMFTNNAIPGAGATRNAWIERVSLASILAILAADLAGLPSGVIATLAAIAAIANTARLALWKPWKTLRTPLVWILHDSYAWIAIHLALRAIAELGWIASPFATHALTIGAIGGMTIGMMTRTALGHSGRNLKAGGAEVACYILVMAAALIRVFGGIALPGFYIGTIVLSAACWSAAFATYALAYWPILTRPRADGKPG
jgi:uncharacterized protein involved in response to NO